jgi:hypothetical protein
MDTLPVSLNANITKRKKNSIHSAHDDVVEVNNITDYPETDDTSKII